MSNRKLVKVHKSPHLASNAIWDTVREMHKQDKKWGANRDLFYGVWHLILSEEVGEFAEACLKEDKQRMRQKMVQVAAVAVQIIEAIDRDL